MKNVMVEYTPKTSKMLIPSFIYPYFFATIYLKKKRMKHNIVFQKSQEETKYIFWVANFFCPDVSVAPLVPQLTSSTLQNP